MQWRQDIFLAFVPIVCILFFGCLLASVAKHIYYSMEAESTEINLCLAFWIWGTAEPTKLNPEKTVIRLWEGFLHMLSGSLLS